MVDVRKDEQHLASVYGFDLSRELRKRIAKMIASPFSGIVSSFWNVLVKTARVSYIEMLHRRVHPYKQTFTSNAILLTVGSFVEGCHPVIKL